MDQLDASQLTKIIGWEKELFKGDEMTGGPFKGHFHYGGLSGPGGMISEYGPYIVRAKKETGPNSYRGLFGHGSTIEEADAQANAGIIIDEAEHRLEELKDETKSN